MLRRWIFTVLAISPFNIPVLLKLAARLLSLALTLSEEAACLTPWVLGHGVVPRGSSTGSLWQVWCRALLPQWMGDPPWGLYVAAFLLKVPRDPCAWVICLYWMTTVVISRERQSGLRKGLSLAGTERSWSTCRIGMAAPTWRDPAKPTFLCACWVNMGRGQALKSPRVWLQFLWICKLICSTEGVELSFDH